MAYFWFDESLHPRGDFALGAIVASDEDLSPKVDEINRVTGVASSRGEFKSGARMDVDDAMRSARDQLFKLLTDHARVLLTVLPYSERAALGDAGVSLLNQALSLDNAPAGPHQVFFDRDLVPRSSSKVPPGAALHLNQDSRLIGGIQLADLAAHALSMILLQRLGVTKKCFPGTGPDWGYDIDAEIDLAFTLWAPLRYRFLSGGRGPFGDVITHEDMFVTVEGYGLYVPPQTRGTLATAVRKEFGRVYLGCIH